MAQQSLITTTKFTTSHGVNCAYLSDFKKIHNISLINTPIWLVVFMKIIGGGKIGAGLGALSSLVIADNKPAAEKLLKLYWKELTLKILLVDWLEETKWENKFIYWSTYK